MNEMVGTSFSSQYVKFNWQGFYNIINEICPLRSMKQYTLICLLLFDIYQSLAFSTPCLGNPGQALLDGSEAPSLKILYHLIFSFS